MHPLGTARHREELIKIKALLLRTTRPELHGIVEDRLPLVIPTQTGFRRVGSHVEELLTALPLAFGGSVTLAGGLPHQAFGGGSGGRRGGRIFSVVSFDGFQLRGCGGGGSSGEYVSGSVWRRGDGYRLWHCAVSSDSATQYLLEGLEIISLFRIFAARPCEGDVDQQKCSNGIIISQITSISLYREILVDRCDADKHRHCFRPPYKICCNHSFCSESCSHQLQKSHSSLIHGHKLLFGYSNPFYLLLLLR